MPYLAARAKGSRIGNFCSIAHDVRFAFLGKHNYNAVSTYPFYSFFDKWAVDSPAWHKGVVNGAEIPAGPIIVENDVWLASNVTVKENVHIGNGAVVAMGSLVTKDVPPYAIVGGNPAKVIRYRFSERQIEALLEIAWWNWPDEAIKPVVPMLLSEDIDALIRFGKNRH
jgi:acetyltransferase-like isoleucine patch superfamily enzyme